MKKFILISLFLLPFLGFSQTHKAITGFLNIPFGSSKATVINAIKAKGGIFEAKESKENVLDFSDVPLGLRKSVLLIVKFVDDKAFEADFFFSPDLEAHIIDYYDSINKDLTLIYGEGNSFKNFKEPYTDGDGYEISAIKLGNADYSTYWPKDAKDDANSVGTNITNTMFIRLRYQDAKLVDIAIAKQNEKNKSEM